jgi:hypothetical protein
VCLNRATDVLEVASDAVADEKAKRLAAEGQVLELVARVLDAQDAKVAASQLHAVTLGRYASKAKSCTTLKMFALTLRSAEHRINTHGQGR